MGMFSKLEDNIKSYAQDVGNAVKSYGQNVATNAKAIVVRPQPKPAAPTDDQVAPVKKI
ncbi:MAG: hypothetical protein LAP86_25835 [Acidobacteriia bacterium]|nr:hypothetical protein [Terriglobia bacterium]